MAASLVPGLKTQVDTAGVVRLKAGDIAFKPKLQETTRKMSLSFLSSIPSPAACGLPRISESPPGARPNENASVRLGVAQFPQLPRLWDTPRLWELTGRRPRRKLFLNRPSPNCEPTNERK
jgi:hypothetical protein